ncbi:MAG: NAD(P)/FAD-dependent oxidoreductase [Gemmataceae bacterium]
MTQGDRWDVVVIGAGAAGLMAALRAAERGKRTLLLEKNRKAGVKILMSGGTRCNVTHATDNTGIIEAYGGKQGRFLRAALANFTVQDTLDFFHGEGVATKVEETGKIFPVSNKAADVLNALLRRLERSRATLALEEPVGRFEQRESHFVLNTQLRRVHADKVIVATGGQSYPGSGTTGDGYHFLEQFGHSLVEPRPALVPITVQEKWVGSLRGITLPETIVRLKEQDKRHDQRRGSLLFAHFGLSGPVILDISRHVSGHHNPETLHLLVDLLPHQDEHQLSQFLQNATTKTGKKQLGTVLGDHLPRRLCDEILVQAGLPTDRTCAGLRRIERSAILQNIKSLRLPVAGTLGFKKAEVTAGGIPLNEVNPKTTESRLVKNIYIVGEILDLDGPIGGYNFQAAWSTGWLAGSSV